MQTIYGFLQKNFVIAKFLHFIAYTGMYEYIVKSNNVYWYNFYVKIFHDFYLTAEVFILSSTRSANDLGLI